MSKTSKIIAYLFLGLMAVLILTLEISTRQARNKMSCTGIHIEVVDSARLGFINARQIKQIIDDEYGTYTGKELDSLDLSQIEEILESKSSILECEAYLTSNGKLNISVLEREPVLKLITTSGKFFIDETGYLFPAQGNYDKELQEIIGNFHMAPDYKGVLGSPKQRYWLHNLLEMIHFIQSERTWEQAFAKIEVDQKGNISLKPQTGKETFYFGPPDDYEEKFGKIRDYYRYVVHLKGEGYYRQVNVKNKGQLVCK